MKNTILELAESVIHDSYVVSEDDAMDLYQSDAPEELFSAAEKIVQSCCTKKAELCSIINAKQGRCPENCRYCAQSAHWKTSCTSTQMILPEDAALTAEKAAAGHITRISLVTAGRALSGKDFDTALECFRTISRKCGKKLKLCASLGILAPEQMEQLKAAGVTRYHHNIETSESFFPSICTTHTYKDRINTIRAAQNTGLEICSGGIIGMGESRKDRIEFAAAIRNLNVQSVPVNILTPIAGTPFQDIPSVSTEEILRTLAVFRFMMPSQTIRCAAGRKTIGNNGERAFRSGANALISGDFLTTTGSSTAEDIAMLKRLGLY